MYNKDSHLHDHLCHHCELYHHVLCHHHCHQMDFTSFIQTKIGLSCHTPYRSETETFMPSHNSTFRLIVQLALQLHKVKPHFASCPACFTRRTKWIVSLCWLLWQRHVQSPLLQTAYHLVKCFSTTSSILTGEKGYTKLDGLEVCNNLCLALSLHPHLVTANSSSKSLIQV